MIEQAVIYDGVDHKHNTIGLTFIEWEIPGQ